MHKNSTRFTALALFLLVGIGFGCRARSADSESQVSEVVADETIFIAAKDKVEKLVLPPAATSWTGVYAVGIGECPSFWIMKALNLPNIGVESPVKGVRIYFSKHVQFAEFAKHALLLGSKVTVSIGGEAKQVPFCTFSDEPPVIQPSVSGGNN